MPTNPVHRVTMFKIKDPNQQKDLLNEYVKLVANNLKDGRPYIRNAFMGQAEPDAAAQGYTVVSKTEFASMEDHKYYVDECPAHQKLKDFIRTLDLEGILSVAFSPQVTGSASP